MSLVIKYHSALINVVGNHGDTDVSFSKKFLFAIGFNLD